MKNTNVYILSVLISIASLFCYGNESEKTLLMFTANWCKYCTYAKNDLRNNDQLSEKIKEYTVIEIDYDKEKDIAKGHGVNTLPTFVIFQHGKELKRQTGYKGSQNLTQFLDF